MFGALSLATYLFISSVYTELSSLEFLGNFSSNIKIECGPTCIDTIPMNKKVACKDLFKDGDFSQNYRNKLKKCRVGAHFNVFIAHYSKTISFGSGSLTISLDEYKSAVHRTISAMIKGVEYTTRENVTDALCHIYKAVKNYHGATDRDLLIFTAIAMHNHNYLLWLQSPRENEKSIGSICRGLMQIKSREYYEKLKLHSSINYINEPWKLDLFNEKTISDEFKLYFREFRLPNARDNASAMLYSVVIMGSLEGQALGNALNSCFGISAIPDSLLRYKLGRRYSILCHLASNMYLRDMTSIISVQL
ncbi:hypothetical protein PAEPH01_2092 [Pancytospora epiphaga]|nr:hypothetical protein PAEPH01_2092 [Pancytospora epiphaga]